MTRTTSKSIEIGENVQHSVIATGNNVQINYTYYQSASPTSTPGTTPLTGPGALRYGNAALSICCDRDEHWQEFDKCVRNRVHQVIFVYGPRGHGHDFFLERIKLHLVCKNPLRVIEPQWQTALPFPRTRPEYLTALSDELKCPVDSLPKRLELELNNHDHLAIHPRIGEDFEHEALQTYYTKWLQELLAGLTTRFCLKCVQPIEWVPVPLGLAAPLALLARLAEFVRLRGPGLLTDALNERRARGMIWAISRRLTARDDCRLLARRLPELTPIRRRHVVKFCQDYLFMDEEEASQHLAEKRVLVGTNNADDVIRAVAKYLCATPVRALRHREP